MTLSRSKLIAITGGGDVKQLGPTVSVVGFFTCVEGIDPTVLSLSGRGLILDRLYRRYVRDEDVDATLAALTLIRDRFDEISSEVIDWAALGLTERRARFDPSGVSLGTIWADFFTRMIGCTESVIYRIRIGKPRPPMKLVRSDFASLDREDKRPLVEYDTLDGPPIWFDEPPPPPEAPSYKDGKVVPHGTPGSIRPDYMSPGGMSATFVHKLGD